MSEVEPAGGDLDSLQPPSGRPPGRCPGATRHGPCRRLWRRLEGHDPPSPSALQTSVSASRRTRTEPGRPGVWETRSQALCPFGAGRV